MFINSQTSKVPIDECSLMCKPAFMFEQYVLHIRPIGTCPAYGPLGICDFTHLSQIKVNQAKSRQIKPFFYNSSPSNSQKCSIFRHFPGWPISQLAISHECLSREQRTGFRRCFPPHRRRRRRILTISSRARRLPQGSPKGETGRSSQSDISNLQFRPSNQIQPNPTKSNQFQPISTNFNQFQPIPTKSNLSNLPPPVSGK